MGIEDIQISEDLETNAPSIKYRGNEGPKSPQDEQRMKMAQLEEAYEQYVDEMIEMGNEPMSMEQFLQQVMAEGQMAGGPPLPNDPTEPVNPFGPKPMGPVLPDRQMAAYGGIMGIDGRRQYGLGSKFKKFVRKIIPNEVAKVAEVAAPFVAPFNPIAAGLMSGIGGFDRTGKIGSSIKSGLMNYGLGQVARGIGGGMGNLQTGFNPMSGMSNAATSGFGKYFTSPVSNQGGLGKMFSDKFSTSGGSMDAYAGMGDPISTGMDLVKKPGIVESIGNKISSLIPESTLGKIALGGSIALGTQLLGGGPEETVSEIMSRGEGLDIDGIRAEVTEAFKDQTGKKLLALRSKYPYLGTQASKDVANMAMGGRIGYADAGAVLSKEQIAMMQNMVKKGMDNSTISTVANVSPEQVQNYIDSLRVKMENKAYGGRIGMEEGGIMDLGGMEKDYRAEGGFVPIGKAEKADDVPARLSVNEFVFTADAVRNAGGGDIDRGAEVMENMMKNLEQGGQVSEESQGMQGARDMFATSQRLSEVI